MKELSMRLSVYVDHRELRSGVIYYLNEKDVTTRVVKNQITDYVIDQQCGIERKTVADFIASIIDKRIFRQARALRENFSKPLILLEGGGLYSRRANIKPNVIRGTLLWLSAAMCLPVIRTYSASDSAEFIRLLSLKRLQQGVSNKYFASAHEKRPRSLVEQQIILLASINGVGRHLAKRLIKEFGSLKNIIGAGENSLSRVPGIGTVKARSIIKVFLTGRQH